MKGYYCVTRQGCLMQFEHPLDQLLNNLIPIKSRDLRGASLGSIKFDDRDAWFTIMSDKWLDDEPSQGVKGYAKATLKMAKHAMLKLTAIKLQMSHREAQRWHHVMAQFSRSRQQQQQQDTVGTRLGLNVLGASSRVSGRVAPSLDEGDDDDQDEEAVIVNVEDLSPSDVQNEAMESEDNAEDAWERRRYQVEMDKFETLADKQPGHITHNPW